MPDLSSWEFAAGHRAFAALIACAAVWAVLIVRRSSDPSHSPSSLSRRRSLARLVPRLIAALLLALGILEPRWIRKVASSRPGELILAFDRSSSMETIDPGSALSRRAIAERWLIGPESSRQLSADHEIKAIGFAGGAVLLPGDPTEWGEVRIPKPERTDWTSLIPLIFDRDAASAGEAAPPPPEGVILFSDGRFDEAPNSARVVEAMERLRQARVPIFTVPIGTDQPPRDAAIRAIRGPARAFPGDEVRLEAEIELNGMAGETAEIVLERPGAEPIRQRATADSSHFVRRIAFTVAVKAGEGAEPGSGEFAISIATLPNEARLDNQRLTDRFAIANRKARILLIEAEPSWEFRYLRNVLTRDPWTEVEAIVLEPPPDLGDPGSAPYRSQPPESLEDWDAIIMGDMDVRAFGDSRWRAIADWVAERGGALALRSGRGSWLSELEATAIGRGLLPVRRPSAVAIADPSGRRPQPVAEALRQPEAWPILQLAGSPEASAQAWATAPPLRALSSGELKPGASALVEIDGATVMASQRYGAGRVLFLGIGDLWRWRDRIGDRLHHRFWGRFARWSAAEGLEVGNRFVRFGTTRADAPEGAAVRFEARFRKDAAIEGVRPNQPIAVRLRVRRAGADLSNDAMIATLRPSDDRPNIYEGEAPGLGIGDYEARLEADDPRIAAAIAQNALPAARFRVIEPRTAERVELAADPEGLRRLAETSGGRALTIAESERWADLVPKRPRTTIRTERTPIWSHPLAVAAILALLTSEWLARLREESKRRPS